jgi:hypothetical protein
VAVVFEVRGVAERTNNRLPRKKCLSHLPMVSSKRQLMVGQVEEIRVLLG